MAMAGTIPFCYRPSKYHAYSYIYIYIYILIHILVYPNDPHIPSISPCIFRAFDGVFDPALAFSHPWWFSWEGSTWRSRCDLTSEK